MISRSYSARYLEYLRSEAWRLKRAERLEIAQGKCAACDVRTALHVHHLTYERLGNENMEDLLPLCSWHHEVAERLKRANQLPTNGHVAYLLVETLRKLHARDKRHRRRVWQADKIFARGKGFNPPRRKWNS